MVKELTVNQWAERIVNAPNGYTHESVEVAKAYQALEARIKELEEILLGDTDHPVHELLEQQREACAEAYSNCNRNAGRNPVNAIRNARIDK